jgi:hypothetical protein
MTILPDWASIVGALLTAMPFAHAAALGVNSGPMGVPLLSI